jgi:hypothetical protein
MNQAQANKQAAKASKTEGAQYVVWVFDDGRYIYNADQARIYAPLIQIEAVFIGGVQVAQAVQA